MIALMMEAARTSQTSVDIDLTTWQYIPEDSELHSLVMFIRVLNVVLPYMKMLVFTLLLKIL
jgi:hypothetical protein